MSFSNEDKKKVFNFFETILLDIDKPVFYEHLRGHVTKAEAVVKLYVTKKCKAENLLQYFKTRKNYFDVSLRGEVSLKKSRCRLLSYKSDSSEIKEVKSIDGNNISEELFEDSEEETFEDSENSFSIDYRRYDSAASEITTDWESVEEYSSFPCNVPDKEKSEYEEVARKYFCRYLSRNERVDISYIEVDELPKKVKRYIKKYMKNKLISFFKNNSDTYRVDDDKYVSLISPSITENSCQKKIMYVEDCVIVDTVEEPFDDSNAADQNFENFLNCVEFFVGILKKKNFVPLKNLSGSLSGAPPGVLVYLKSNYKNYKKFLLFASSFFTINESEEVSLSKDCFKLLKRAKKLLRLKSNVEFFSQPVENIITSHFKIEIQKTRNSSLDDEMDNSVNEQPLEHHVMNISNEDTLCSTSYTDPEHKSSSLYEISKASDRENVDVKSFDYCENGSRDVYHQITPKNTPCETQHDLLTTSLLASDQEILRPEKEVQLSDNFKDVSNFDEIQVLDEIIEKNALGPNAVLFDAEIETSVKPDYDTFTENDERTDICILSNKIIEEQTSRDFIECAFITQLLCLEIIEKEKILTLAFEYEAVKYFVEILEFKSSIPVYMESIDLNFLKGKVGQTSVGVKLFLKQFYKGEKIISFFQKHDEFLLDSCNWVKLSPHYKKSLENRRIENEAFNEGLKLYHVHSLYNSYFHDFVAEVFDCLSKICCFLKNKSKLKFSRLCGVFSKFSTIQQNFVDALSGSLRTEKLEKFLLYYNKLFHFDDVYIQLNPEIDISFLVNSVTEFSKKLKLSTESKLTYFHHLLDFVTTHETVPLDYEELMKKAIQYVQDFLSYTSCCNYSDLPIIIGYDVLCSLILESKDSQCLIKLLEDCDLFELINGQIFLRKDTAKAEGLSDNPVSQDESSSSFLEINDTCNIDNPMYKADIELEGKDYTKQVCDKYMSLDENTKSVHQDSDAINSNSQPSCTDNTEFKYLLKEKENSEHSIESISSYFKTKKEENSLSDLEVECMNEEKDNVKQVSAGISSSAFPTDSCLQDSAANGNSSSCIKETIYLTDEKYDEQAEIMERAASSKDDDQNENSFLCNSDKSLNEGKVCVEATENLTNNNDYHNLKAVKSNVDNLQKNISDQTLINTNPLQVDGGREKILAFTDTFRANSEMNKVYDTHCNKSNLSSTLPSLSNIELSNDAVDILKVDHAAESDTHENMELNHRLETDNQEIFLNKISHTDEVKGGSKATFVKNDDVLKKGVNKFISEFNLPSEEYEINLVDSESNEIHNIGLTFSSSEQKTIVKSSELFDDSVNYGSFISGTSSSDINRFKVSSEDSSISEKCLKLSTLNEDNDNVTELRERNKTPTASKNRFELSKSRENLNDDVQRETRPAYLVSKNSSAVTLQKEDVNSGVGKETSNTSLTVFENASGFDKENTEKNKLDANSCLQRENMPEASRGEENKKKSLKYDSIQNVSKGICATVRNETEFEKTKNVEDTAFLDGLKRNSKNACINQILKSNIATEVAVDHQTKSCFREKILNENNEITVAKSNLHQAKDGVAINKSSYLFSVSECSNLDHEVSIPTGNGTAEDKSSLKKMQEGDFKATLSWDKNMHEDESVVESNSGLTVSDLKFSDDSISELQNQSPQPRFPENCRNSSNKFPESCKLRQDEKCDKSGLSNQYLNLQPLQSKVILLTTDSCIVETIIDGRKKYVFCLKSSFHCDEHIDCLCFNSLAVGHSVQCYLQPGADFNCGNNMSLSFMICRDSNVSRNDSKLFSSKMPSKELHLDKSKSSFQEENKSVNAIIPDYPSVKQSHFESKVGECQIDISENMKHFSSSTEDKCLAKCTSVPQSAQTDKYEERSWNTCENRCHMQISTALQGTQTTYESSENECQTFFSGAVKLCTATEDKACQMKSTVISLSIQTSCEHKEKETQTDVWSDSNAPVCTSSECNTILSGPVKRCVLLTNKSSQASLVNVVCQATQTVLQKEFAHNRSELADGFSLLCNAACQTISTGPVMIKKYYM